VTLGPAVRSYGGLPALWANTWVCPYSHHTTTIGSILDGLDGDLAVGHACILKKIRCIYRKTNILVREQEWGVSQYSKTE